MWSLTSHNATLGRVDNVHVFGLLATVSTIMTRVTLESPKPPHPKLTVITFVGAVLLH